MAIKLSPAKPDDRYARMYFAFTEKDGATNVVGKTEEEADDNTGWIELWSDDAKACKDALRRIGGRLYVLGERREKRKAELSDENAVAEIEEYNRLIIEGLAHRTKDWLLVNSAGEIIEAQCTFENRKAVYGDEDHNLREVIQEFLKDRTNFPLRASANS